MVEVGARAIGARVLRAEDPRILTGRGRYVDDVVLPGMLHAAFKRSTVPHGRLVSIDVIGRACAARRRRGVHRRGPGPPHATRPRRAARSGCDLMPGLRAPAVLALATDKVRYVGDPIALVVAEDRYLAEDAVELIEEDIEFLEPVVTYEDAPIRRSPRCSTSSTTTSRTAASTRLGDVAGRVRQGRPGRRRRASGSIVTSRCRWSAAGSSRRTTRTAEQLTIRSATQSPHMIRILLAPQVDVPMEKIRVLADDVGGGFGLKNGVQRDEVAVDRGVHRPRSAGEVDRGPARAPRRGRTGARGGRRHRGGGHRRRRAARRADRREAEPRCLRLRPVQRRHLRRIR